MASNQEDLLIKIQADMGNASQSMALLVKQLGGVEDSLKGVANSSHGTESAVTGLGAKMFIVNGALELAHKGFEFLKDQVQETLGEFLKSQDGYVRLGNTMRIVGEQDVQGSIAAFRLLAETMQETTTVEDDQVIRLANIAKATGLSTEKTEELIKASADLAATGKTDLNGAFNALLKSLNGSTMGLAVMLPELSNLSKESAKAGDAVKYIRDSLGGLAEKELQTTSGQLIQAHNRFMDLKKGVGEVIAAFLGLHAGSNILNSTLGSMVEWLHHNKDGILEFGQAVHDGFITFVNSIKGLYAGLLAVDWGKISKEIAAVGISLAVAFAVFNAGAVVSLLTGVVTTLALLVIEVWAAVTAITAMAVAWARNASAMALVTIQYALVTAGIATIVMAISLVLNNLKELPALAAASFQAVAIGAGTAVESMLRFVGAGEEADAVAAGVDRIGESFAKNASVLDGGLVGGGIAELNKFKTAFLETVNGAKEKAGELGDGAIKPKTEIKIYSPEALKAVEELRLKNKTLYLEVFQGEMTAQRLISAKEKMEIDAVNSKYKDIELTAEGNKELQKQIKLIEAKFAAQQKKAPSVEFQQAAKSGTKLAATISGSITGGLSGVGGMITGMMSGAGAVMAAADGVVGSIQGVIDFIPKILNSVANVFNSLADLPLKILDGVKNLMASLVKVVADLIPNLFTAVPDIVFSILDTLFAKLPAMAANLIKSLPDLMLKLLDRIPKLVTTLVEDIVAHAPDIAIALTTSLIGNIPKIVVALAKATYITIPKAIIKGIMEGLKSIKQAITAMFGGGLFGKKKQKLEFDTKSLTESMKKAAAALTGESSKLFKVMDLTGGDTTAAEKTKENISAIEEAGGRARDWLMQAWDKVMAGFGNLMTWFGEVWHVFLAAVQSVFGGIIQMFRDVFFMARDIFNLVIAGLTEVMNAIEEVGKRIAQGVTDGLAAAGTFFGDLGAQIWQGLWAGLQGLPAFFTNMFNDLNPGNLFERMFRVPSSPQGTVETALGINIPFMNFAKGGMVPGNAQVAGDSLMNDRVLAMISPGEAVVPRSKMNNPFLGGLVQGVLDGTISPPKFADGYLGKVTSHAVEVAKSEADKAREFLASLSPAQMWDMVKDKVLKEMIPNMLANNKFHEGGIIGGSGDVPILGQAGEFVMQRSAVSGIGQGNLSQMNKTGSTSQGNTSNVYNIDIKVDAKTAPDEKFIRGTLLPILKEELRRASLDGQRVIFQSGVRA